MSAETWGKSPKKPKQKRDAWAKPKRGRRKKDFGAVSKKEKKKDKAWGRPVKGGDKGILDTLGGGNRRGGWLGKVFKRPRGLGLREYYNKIDKLQASEIQAGVREQLAERYQSEIEQAETLTQKLQRFVEGITRKRLGSGQADELGRMAKEVVSPNRVIAFVTNLFK